jgi:hypothetical protein
MRDSKMQQALADIGNLSRTKLGNEWAWSVLYFVLQELGFTPVGIVKFDGEIVEMTITRLIRQMEMEEQPVGDD